MSTVGCRAVGAPTLTVRTTAPGSLVFATGHDWDSATARTLGAGQSLVHEFSDTATLDDSWVQRTTNPVPAATTTVTVNDTAPTTNRWDLTAVEITAPPTAPAVAAFTYNQANELTASTTPAGASAGYTYDGDGLRAARTTSAATQKFAWALSGGLPVLLTDATLSYLYDDHGIPVEQIDAAGVALYYQHDQYGSTRLLTDAAGAVAATFSYDPYGNLTGHTGTTDTPLRWNGQYQDTDTALYYLRARYYDPTTAQFLTRDLLAALTANPYGYADANPLLFVDPLGLDWWNPAPWDADTLDNASVTLSGVALVLTITGVGAPVAALLEGAAVAASLTAAYKHGEDGDTVGMVTSMVAAVPGLGAIAGDAVRIGARATAKAVGTLECATGGAARTLGDRISLFGDAMWMPQAAVQAFSTPSASGASSTGQYGSSSCYGGAA